MKRKRIILSSVYLVSLILVIWHNQLSRRKFSSLLQYAQCLCIFQKIVYTKVVSESVAGRHIVVILLAIITTVPFMSWLMLHLLRLFFRVAVMVVYIEIQGKYPHTLSIRLYCNLLALWLVQSTWCFCHGVELHLFLRPRGWASPFSSSHSGEYFYTASSGLVCWGV